jgi:hypothetical protein
MTTTELVSRALSLLIALFYFVGTVIGGGPKLIIPCAAILFFPLYCIWFSEGLGEYTGWTSKGMITSKTPDWMIAGAGWIVLLLPSICLVVSWFRGS